MFAETGQMALALAFAVALAQGVLPLLGAARRSAPLMRFGQRAACVQAALLSYAFVTLTILFLRSDFSVKLVALHSHTEKPLIYKISGIWANHEGSMLLWVLILALFGGAMAIYGRSLPMSLRARALAVQGWLGAGFLGFLVFTSNPFERLFPVPVNGQGLNPLLQDPGLAIHPPLLYIGYVGFSVAFSLAVAALIEGRVDAVWARWLRPWVLFAWSFLTLGITIGSIWAYYELGWGGWWMWDPVENVSFLPWLAGTALLHSILTLQQRHSFAHWTVLLAISTFSLSMIGTFVVRSGVLVSVHAFAVDSSRGVFILMLILIFTGAALALYAARSRTLMARTPLSLISRESGLVINNLVITAATAIVFLGTFYPLFIEGISGEKISVGAPYFDIAFAPIMCALMVVMAVAPMIKWRKDSLPKYRKFLFRSGVVLLIVLFASLLIGKSIWGAIAVGIAVWLIIGTLTTLYRRTQGQWSLLRRQPAGTWGFVISHLGVAVFALGVTAMSLFAQEELASVSPGETVSISGYDFVMGDLTRGVGENFQRLSTQIEVTQGGQPVATLTSEQRYYPVREMVTSEAGFHLSWGPTLFAGISENSDGGATDTVIMRAYYQPGVVWIWIGALMIAMAGFISLFDRRLRVPGKETALS